MAFGSDVEIAPAKSYINLVRGIRKFGIVQISAADRMDIGIKRKGVAPTERFEVAGIVGTPWSPIACVSPT